MSAHRQPTCDDAIGGFASPMPSSHRADRRHEEMNALSIISSVASLIAPGMSERDRARMDRLNRAVARLTHLIESEAEDAATSIAATPIAPIDVECLVREVAELSRPRAERARVRLVIECRGGTLRGDGAALRDALLDWVGSAIEATPQGHAVHLETIVTAQGDQVWTIKTEGGATPERVMRSAPVAMQSGGSLAFQAREGQGSTVRVWLPRDGRRAEPPRSASEPIRAGNVVQLRIVG